MKPIVAIVGRPNVGKSTLFNRLVGRPIAIVSDIPGTTRDRIFADIALGERVITIVDTGGLEPEPGTVMGQKVKEQVEIAVREADAVLFLLDVNDGLLPADLDIAEMLRRSGKKIVAAVNKVDTLKLEAQVGDFHRLGIEPIIPISAYHAKGIADLKEALAAIVPEGPEEPAVPANALKIAMAGRPGVGKSTLLNTIVGKQRAVVSDTPGTTRDATDTIVRFKDRDVVLIDTAGIKQRGRVGWGISYYSLLRSLRAIDRCDVALLLIDGGELATAQDTHVAQYLLEARKGIVVVVNKSDLIPAGGRDEAEAQVRERLKFVPWAPVVYISAREGAGVGKVLPEALAVWEERNRHLPENVVNDIIKNAVESHPPMRRSLVKLDVRGGYQIGVSPPTFAVLVNDPKLVHFSYQRYLENRLRQVFKYKGTPVVLVFKKVAKSHNRGVKRA